MGFCLRPIDRVWKSSGGNGSGGNGSGGRCERVRKLKRCTGLWGMLVCGSNEHPEPPSCRSAVECVCACVRRRVEHIIRPAAARRPNNRPRTHTNRNTSHSEQKPQITKGGVLGRPGVRFQSSESGCRLAAERLEALLETNPFAWTVSKKKQCAVFRPLDKGGWTMLYRKKQCSWRLMHSL